MMYTDIRYQFKKLITMSTGANITRTCVGSDASPYLPLVGISILFFILIPLFCGFTHHEFSMKESASISRTWRLPISRVSVLIGAIVLVPLYIADCAGPLSGFHSASVGGALVLLVLVAFVNKADSVDAYIASIHRYLAFTLFSCILCMQWVILFFVSQQSALALVTTIVSTTLYVVLVGGVIYIYDKSGKIVWGIWVVSEWVFAVNAFVSLVSISGHRI